MMESAQDMYIGKCDHCGFETNQPKFMPFSTEELTVGLVKSKSVKEYDKKYGWFCPKCKKKIKCLNIVGTDKKMLAEAMSTTCASCSKKDKNCPFIPNNKSGMICSFYKRR